MLLALITDARAGRVADCMPRWISLDAAQVQLLSGRFRVPVAVRPLVRAALLDHQTRGLPAHAMFRRRDSGLLLSQAMANLIGRAAELADLPISHGATRAGNGDSWYEEPFAAALVNHGTRIDDSEVSPRPRVQLPRLPEAPQMWSDSRTTVVWRDENDSAVPGCS